MPVVVVMRIPTFAGKQMKLFALHHYTIEFSRTLRPININDYRFYQITSKMLVYYLILKEIFH